MDRHAATSKCQRVEIETLRRNLEETLDSLNSWNVGEPNPLDSGSGALPDSIRTSTSSTSRVTEVVINYLLRAGHDLGRIRKTQNP